MLVRGNRPGNRIIAHRFVRFCVALTHPCQVSRSLHALNLLWCLGSKSIGACGSSRLAASCSLTIRSSGLASGQPLSSGVRLPRAGVCWLAAIVQAIASSRIASVGSASRSRIHAECRGPCMRPIFCGVPGARALVLAAAHILSHHQA